VFALGAGAALLFAFDEVAGEFVAFGEVVEVFVGSTVAVD